jgi:hypothetical protein
MWKSIVYSQLFLGYKSNIFNTDKHFRTLLENIIFIKRTDIIKSDM